jgi:acyl carrier protein/D-alanine--poly(phosphoribitol) ligase subunit 2
VNAEQVESALLAFLRDEILPGEAVDPDSELISSGLVDSVDLVKLAAFIERSVGVEIPDRDINAEHFETVRSIMAYLRLRLGA